MDDLLSLHAFLVFMWIGAGVMTVCFVARAYIRYICFGRLLLEDWLVGAALIVFLAATIVWQLYLRFMYDMTHAVEGTFTPGPTFIEDTKYALWACGSQAISAYVGLWLIKASFLVLFYRLGHKIKMYLYAWWVCACVVMACGIAGLGLNQYQCMFGDIDFIFATCMSPETLLDSFHKEIAAAVLDVSSDLLLIVFPIWILWSTRVSTRQKIVFSAIFCLVGLTISIAIIRGAFAKNIIGDPKYSLKQINIAWSFWFTVEYMTSFLVACAISFRSLFVQHRAKLSAAGAADERRATPATSVGKNRVKYYLYKLSETLVSTARHLEGTEYEHETWKLPMPTSGLMTVDFSRDEGWRRMGEEDDESMRALKPVEKGQNFTVVSAV